MRINKSQYSFRITLLLISILFVACSEKKNKQETKNTAVVQESEIVDENSLFNGKTLDGWKITQYGTEGPVLVSDGKIVLNYGDGCTGITWEKDFPKVNYEVTLEAQKTSGNDFFCGMTFPVGKEPCTLIIGGWGGTTVGLSSINWMDASENQTTTYMTFEKDQWYRISLLVHADTIRAAIDDEVVVNYVKDKYDELSVRPEVDLSRPFGIASWSTAAELKNIRMVRIDD